jgi:hypothetical protein
MVSLSGKSKARPVDARPRLNKYTSKMNKYATRTDRIFTALKDGGGATQSRRILGCLA